MQVILIQNVPNLGKAGEVKDVRDGFAQNFLIPRGLARPANQESLSSLEAERRAAVRKQEEHLRETERLVARLQQTPILISVKAGEGGKLFGSVSNTAIARALEVKGFAIKKDQVRLRDPIRELGEYRVIIDLPHGLEAELEISVISEPRELE